MAAASGQPTRESVDRYSAVCEAAADGVALMPTDEVSVRVNRSFARMHGYSSPEEMTGMRLGDIDAPETARLAPGRLRRILAGEGA